MSLLEYDDFYDFSPESKCKDCDKYALKLFEAAHFFEEILQQLYSTKTLDLGILEHCLDETAHLLGVKMIETAEGPMVRRAEYGLCEIPYIGNEENRQPDWDFAISKTRHA